MNGVTAGEPRLVHNREVQTVKLVELLAKPRRVERTFNLVQLVEIFLVEEFFTAPQALTQLLLEDGFETVLPTPLAAFAEDIEKAGPEVADWALARRTTSIDALPVPPVFAPAEDKKPERRRTLVFKSKRG